MGANFLAYRDRGLRKLENFILYDFDLIVYKIF